MFGGALASVQRNIDLRLPLNPAESIQPYIERSEIKGSERVLTRREGGRPKYLFLN